MNYFTVKKPALALYQPDIAGNTGTLIRLSACMATNLHIIEPAGFRTDDTHLKRAGMDYQDLANIIRHDDFIAFLSYVKTHHHRLVLLTTKTDFAYTDHRFENNDILMLGRESAGVPENVHKAADISLTIPMQGAARSINQAVSAAMVLGEALRQTAK